jgi:hypothetical protein
VQGHKNSPRSRAILGGVGLYLLTDISGQYAGPFFQVSSSPRTLGLFDPWRWDWYPAFFVSVNKGRLSSAVKRPSHQDDHSLHLINKWSYTSTTTHAWIAYTETYFCQTTYDLSTNNTMFVSICVFKSATLFKIDNSGQFYPVGLHTCLLTEGEDQPCD